MPFWFKEIWGFWAFLHFFPVFPICDGKRCKNTKKMISTSQQHVKHPLAGQKTQHYHSCNVIYLQSFGLWVDPISWNPLNLSCKLIEGSFNFEKSGVDIFKREFEIKIFLEFFPDQFTLFVHSSGSGILKIKIGF